MGFWFKNKFLEIVKKYKIGAFLRIDPMIEGLDVNIPSDLDCCKSELERLLDNYIERKNEVLYSKIEEFKYYLDKYNENLSIILFPDLNNGNLTRFIYRNNDVDEERKKKEEIVLQYRQHLEMLMNEIALDIS